MIFSLKNLNRFILLFFLLVLSYFIAIFIIKFTIITLFEKYSLNIISINAIESFNSLILLTFYIFLLFSYPLIIQLLIFYVKDALYQSEVNFLKSFRNNYILFLLGALYGYYTSINYLIPFLLSFNDKINVESTISINNLVVTILKNCLLFSIIFLTPFIIKQIIKYNIITKQKIKSKRKYIYFYLLVLSALLTPSDVLSMIVCFIPFVILFELGLYLAKPQIRL